MLDPVLNLAIFIIWWWISLFVMLPLGVRSLEEGGEKEAAGHDQGAPVSHNLKQKALWALGAAAILWLITAALIYFDPLNLRPDLAR